MTFLQDEGYLPQTIDELMSLLRENLNIQFNMNYDENTFAGTNWYKYIYAAAQLMQRNEIATSEIFVKLQQYISETNERIQRPSVSYPGLIDSFLANGYVISVDPQTNTNKGEISICVDVDSNGPDYAAEKLKICNLVKQFVAAGVTSQGDQVESIVLDNGQSFDFKFYLPTVKPTRLELTIAESDNNLLTVPSDEDIRFLLLENLRDRYRMGWDFEPQRYFNTKDAPWASNIQIRYSFDDGSSWNTIVYDANFKDLLTFSLEKIDVILV